LTQAEKIPPRTLPIVYFSIGHLALVLALLLVATRPTDIAGFFYHARMFTAVHLVTLGWITCSILGATYLVAPFALRTTLPATKTDSWICALLVFGTSGIVAHFWLEHYSGLVTSGAVTFLALTGFAHRVWPALRRAKSPPGVRLLVGLAHVNLQLAVLAGVLIAVNKVIPFLPGNHLLYVFSHVHLAIVGWAIMMVLGVGYRLLPMFLPAAPPEGRSILFCAVILESGLLGLAVSLPISNSAARIAAIVVAAGLVIFFVDVARMFANRRKRPPQLPQPDLGMFHAFQALAYLVASTGIGLYMLFTPGWQLRGILLYGTFGLLGFLGQIILGLGMRLFPMFAWMEGMSRSSVGAPWLAPHDMPSRPLQYAILILWTVGVPLLGFGLALDRIAWVGAGGWALTGAALLASVNTARVLRHAFPKKIQDSA